MPVTKEHGEIHASPPFTDEDVAQLRVGDHVKFYGTIYTARDAAHRRMIEQCVDNAGTLDELTVDQTHGSFENLIEGLQLSTHNKCNSTTPAAIPAVTKALFTQVTSAAHENETRR